ncbi:N,N-dimethylformamidase beta subunit family domain-containing protein [Stigmatella erecta]|uniref:NHL repeat-containing protein n=1 Tax=Stigmatella erecta TaxID=83460 RepID=A0A1I0JDA5_9BACT|nr:N,N-dimethylformamidase beta subunit family domain-containing protein [Stigmatella erecta]SEU07193.1 NHL repeat-containing protein [Stigmatella erecta]
MTQGWRWGGTAAAVMCLMVGLASCQEGGTQPSPAPPDSRSDTPPLEGSPPPAAPGEGNGGTPEPPLPPAYDAAAIQKENQRLGARDWRITRNANNGEIEGYPLVTTVTPGQRVPVAVNVSEPRTFRWFVYRLGHYGGLGAREVARGGPVPGTPQPPCPVEEATGAVACQWAPTLELETKADWVRGVYVVKLVREDNYQRYVPFFVRDERPRSEVVALIPTATWAAYNTWGGTSLYDDKLGVMKKKYGVSRAFQVSYDRPYYRGQGTGHLMLDDVGLIQWLESQGLDVGYVTNEDLDASGDFLRAAKVLFLSGHDEYWTSTLRDRADQAVAEGRSLINLGANQAYWHVRLEPSKDGRPRRLVTCYKGDSREPVGARSPLRTVKFRDAPLSRPENALFGVMFNSRWHQFAFPTVITHPEHWALEGTGLQKGDTLWMTNGYEQDAIVQNGQTPPGVEVLADSPSLSLQGAFGFSQMVVRRQGSAWIFSSGGIDFVQVLAGAQAADPRGARIVANVLYRALGRPVPGNLVSFRPREPVAPRGPFASRVLTVAGQAGMRGNIDGPDGMAQMGAPVAVAVLPAGGWVVADALANSVKRISSLGEVRTVLTGLNGPLGLAADTWGNVYVADSENHCIRRISPDGTATVLAGMLMEPGQTDGLAQAARFNQPAGLAFTPGGDLLVADLGNGVIRRVELATPGNPVTTVSADKWMYRPSAVASAADGTLYVVETGMARVLEIRQGVVSVIAGSTAGYADGAPASSQLLPYLGIAVLKDGSVAVADPGNYRIRRILFTAGGKPSEVTTLAGTGRFGSRDGEGRAADFVLPAGLAVGPDGTLYVADAGNALLRAVMP